MKKFDLVHRFIFYLNHISPLEGDKPEMVVSFPENVLIYLNNHMEMYL